jgi:hypothetical protein
MPLNDSRIAYEDCYDIMGKALVSEDGMRVGYPTEDEAKYLQMRMNYARTLDRKFNRGRYAHDHPMHGKSEFDVLTFRVRRQGDRYWLYAERKPPKGVIEEITKDKKIDPVRQMYRRS